MTRRRSSGCAAPVCGIYRPSPAPSTPLSTTCAPRASRCSTWTVAGRRRRRHHQGVLDITYLRMIPNMICMAPSDEMVGGALATALAAGPKLRFRAARLAQRLTPTPRLGRWVRRGKAHDDACVSVLPWPHR